MSIFVTLRMKPLCVTMLYKVVLIKFVDQILVCDHSKKAIEQYFYVWLLNTLDTLGSSIFKSRERTLVCDHSNESYMY